MYIQANHTQNQLSGVTGAEQKAQQEALQAATIGRSESVNGKDISVSEEAKRLNESNSVYTLSTAGGDREYDLDSYFEPKPAHEASLLDLDSVLLPNTQNVSVLQDHLSKIFPEFLSRHDIPEAPETIRYDYAGQVVLPADYPYADQLKQALKEEPAIARELSTVNALASHLAALKELEPYHQEMEKAATKAEIDAVIDKYSHLLSDNRSYPEVELSFIKEGQVTVTSKGNAVA
ncbi:hypothetical protein [Neptuniibacter sp.]|uniref:hypothetical protein n=1 Tax=Neptuniibacter sp. TaxID=1962643 RepID=UPI002615F9D9|nr:hypothetical protein [Neptuniibacter sp.]MCP4595308.1 hypothetical protein [Neptuniibacter sp.]